MFSHHHQMPPTQHVSQRLPCLHRLVSVAFVPCSSPCRRLQVAVLFTSALLPLSSFDSLTSAGRRHQTHAILNFAPCANLSCLSMQDSGPCSGPGPTGDAVVTLYRILSLVFHMFHLFSFVLDHLLPLFSCSSYTLPIGQ